MGTKNSEDSPIMPLTSAAPGVTLSSQKGESKYGNVSPNFRPHLSKFSLTQFYTCFIFVLDLFVLFLVLISPPSARLTRGTMWFDNILYDRPQTVVLWMFLMVMIVLSSLCAVWNRFNRWVLLHHALVETLRLGLFIFLLSRLEHPGNRHTIILALMLLNAIIHTHHWYSTWCLLCQNAK